MPEPHQVKLEHITYLLALILGGEVQESAVKLLMPAITPEHALAIRDEWKGYIHPPHGHPLEGAHAIREMILATLTPAYTTREAGTQAAKVLLDTIGDALHVEAFRQYTVEDLEEEMEVRLLPPSPTPPITAQYLPEHIQNPSYTAGVIPSPPQTMDANRGPQRKPNTTTLGNGTLSHVALDTTPALQWTSPMEIDLPSNPLHRSSTVSTNPNCGQRMASPLTGGGDAASQHSAPQGTTPPQLPPIRTIDD